MDLVVPGQNGKLGGRISSHAPIRLLLLPVVCGISIPSTEVIMRLSLALDTTPDEFLVGTLRRDEEAWKSTAELLRTMSPEQLKLARSFLLWLSEQER